MSESFMLMSNLLDARGWRWGGAVWGKGLHENVMLPSDSSCSTGTACFCVNEVNCRLGKEKKKVVWSNFTAGSSFFNTVL